MEILNKEQIRANLDIQTAISQIEKGFVAYSKGEAAVPSVGHLPFDTGDCHIKYGHIPSDPYFVIKIATGFNTNRAKGLPTSNGMMIIMDAATGFPTALLQDEGMLTDIRTAMAGFIAAKYLGPDHVEQIGIIGSGCQARLQLEYLTYATNCRSVEIWSRTPETAKTFAMEMISRGFHAAVTGDVETLVRECNLIVTATSSKTPLIQSEWIQKGTHITAVGADAPGKQEIDEKIVEIADIICVDSYSQCMDHGEIATAAAKGRVKRDRLTELGEIIAGGAKARTDNRQITLADLTGVAVQDIKIALCVYNAFINQSD